MTNTSLERSGCWGGPFPPMILPRLHSRMHDVGHMHGARCCHGWCVMRDVSAAWQRRPWAVTPALSVHKERAIMPWPSGRQFLWNDESWQLLGQQQSQKKERPRVQQNMRSRACWMVKALRNGGLSSCSPHLARQRQWSKSSNEVSTNNRSVVQLKRWGYVAYGSTREAVSPPAPVDCSVWTRLCSYTALTETTETTETNDVSRSHLNRLSQVKDSW